MPQVDAADDIIIYHFHFICAPCHATPARWQAKGRLGGMIEIMKKASASPEILSDADFTPYFCYATAIT